MKIQHFIFSVGNNYFISYTENTIKSYQESFEEDTLMSKSFAQFYQFLFKNNLLRKK